MKCPKCKGKKPRKFSCKFCVGKENLDWIEVLLGVENDGTLQMEQTISKMAHQLSVDIDKEILKELIEKRR